MTCETDERMKKINEILRITRSAVENYPVQHSTEDYFDLIQKLAICFRQLDSLPKAIGPRKPCGCEIYENCVVCQPILGARKR